MKIKQPSAKLLSIIGSQNIENFSEWVKLLESPFKNKGYHFFSIYSWTDNAKDMADGVLSQEDVLRVHFPTTLYALHGGKDTNENDEALLILQTDNKAQIIFLGGKEHEHSVEKHQRRFTSGAQLNGTWVAMVKIYLEYVRDLTAIPQVEEKVV